MAMTRKYYKIIANCIANSDNKESLIRQLKIELKKDNPNFNTNIFEDACYETKTINTRK